MPLGFVVGVGIVLGLAIGSFLNVVIHRVPAGLSVVRPPSGCPACGQEIRARDNVPVLSWLLLRGRCRDCQAPISRRYPVVELATAALFAGVAVRFGDTAETPIYWVFVACLVAVSAVDLDTQRIPTPILVATVALGAPILAVAAFAREEPWPLARAALGALGAFGALFAVHFVSPAGMGFGDVRFAFVLGLFLGWLGPGQPVLGLFLGFLGGSVVGIGLMVLGSAGRRTRVPFGPFLALGGLVAVLWGDALLAAYPV
jgi:leader peptidase (prepilin peptidase) / N-methyltransferase